MKKQQLKFWCYVKKYLEDFPGAALSRFIRKGIESRISYLNYYQQLENEYGDPKSCENTLKSNYSLKWEQLFELNTENDRDSRLGTYHRIDPQLVKCVPEPQTILEVERVLVTRFRTGCHSLAVEFGRYTNIPRENRLCRCGEMQSIWHVTMVCPLTKSGCRYNQNIKNSDMIEDLLIVGKTRL